MSRIKVFRDLPSLASVIPQGESIHDRLKPAYDNLAGILERVILDLRKCEPSAFYSMRDIAAYFKTDLKTTRKAFFLLQEKGLLSLLRGSSSLILPQTSLPRRRIRGVVGIPVWRYGFCNLPDWRIFHIRIEAALRKYDYLANLIFFGEEDRNMNVLLKRIDDHHPDMVLWYQPLRTYSDLLHKLEDVGIRSLLVPDKDVHLPFGMYRVSKGNVADKICKQWRGEGIKKVIVLVTPGVENFENREILRQASHYGMNVELVTLWAHQLQDYLKAVRYKKDLLFMIPEIHLCSMFCRYSQEAMVSLINEFRVLLPCHLDIEKRQLTGLKADFFMPDMTRLARQISRDIALSKYPRKGEEHFFLPEYHCQSDCGDFARLY